MKFAWGCYGYEGCTHVQDYITTEEMHHQMFVHQRERHEPELTLQEYWRKHKEWVEKCMGPKS